MTGQRIHVNAGYILPVWPYQTFYLINGKQVEASNDTDGDGVLDSKYWLDRFGSIRPPGDCASISLDCLPATWEGSAGVPLTRAQEAAGCTRSNYVRDDMRAQCRPMQGMKDIRFGNADTTVSIVDMDITPPGVRSWIAEAWVITSTRSIAVLPEIEELHKH